MSDDITFRPYQKEDAEGIVSLLKHVFPAWRVEGSQEIWSHIYTNNYLYKNLISVAEKKGEIIGCNHDIFLKVKICGKTYNTCLTGDLAVHENYRGMGIWPKMIEVSTRLRKENNASFIYYITMNPQVIETNKNKLKDFTLTHTIDNIVRINDIDLYLKNVNADKLLLRKTYFSSLKKINRFLSSRTKPNNFIIKEINNFEKMGELLKIYNDYHSFIVERTKEYLSWKYHQLKNRKYIIKALYSEHELLGFIVLEEKTINDYTEGYIVDLLTTPGRPDVAESLIVDACKYFDDLGINSVNVWTILNHPYVKIYSKNGFIDNRIKPFIGFRYLVNDPNLKESFNILETLHPEQLHIQYSDLESI